MANQVNWKTIPTQPIIKGDGKAAKLGDRFEVLVLTHFAIICALDENFRKKNARITFNAKDHGNLDDIVVLSDDQLILVQLKHKAEKGNIAIKFDDYERTYNNIILPKYKQYVDKGLIKINVVVFTNSNVLKPKDKNINMVKSSNPEIDKFKTGKGEIFQLQNQNTTTDFFKNLYIFSGQYSATNNIEMLSNNIKTELNKYQIKAIFDYFDRSVIGRTEPFTIVDICSVLNECIIKPSIIFSNNSKFSLHDSIINLFGTIFQNNKRIIISNKYKELFISFINRCLIKNSQCTNINYGKKIPQEDLDKLFKEKYIRKCLPTKEGPYTYDDLLIAFWQIGKCSIMIEYTAENQDQIDYSINKLMNKEREGPIIILHDGNVHKMSNYGKKIEEIDLFENANNEMKNHILETIKINVGKETKILADIIGKDDSSLKKITPAILLSILDNSLTLINLRNIPDIYIPRTLETKFVTESIFKIPDVLFIIHHDDSKLDLEKFLVDQLKYKNVNVVNSKLSLKKTKDKVQSISRKCCCVVKFGENYKIYHQNENVKNLEHYTYRKELQENEILNNANTLVKIICADAGMGKSYLMEFQLQSQCVKMGKLPLYFNLSINFREINKLERNEKTFITYFAKHLANNKNDKEQIKFLETVIEYNMKEKNMVLLLDGFDEAKLECQVINYLLSLNLDVVVSTRTHKLNELLKNCDCLDLSLLTFTPEKQKEFFQRSYKSEEIDELEEMIQILNKNVQNSLMGIPLQIKHLIDIFPTINDFFEKKDEINIFFLYKEFLEKHLNQTNVAKKMLIQKFACAILLDTALLKDLSIDKEEIIKTTSDFEFDNKINFIITGFKEDTEPIFVHKTYAEFLCADYLADKCKLPLAIFDELLKEDLVKVKYFFDIILCKNLKLHFALLTKNNGLIEKYLSDENCLKQQDKFGRTILHIISTYGERHSQIYKEQSKTFLTVYKSKTEFTIPEEILIQISKAAKKNNIQISKDNWNRYPFEYAMQTRSFNSLDQLVKYFGDRFSVSAAYDYINIFNALQTTDKFHKIITDKDFENNVSSKLNLKNVEKYAFINTCARHGSREIVNTLLKRNLYKINKCYYSGQKCKMTALETAVHNWGPDNENQASFILMLMENGAKDVTCKNKDIYGSLLHLLATKIGYDSHNLINPALPKFIKSHQKNYINSKNIMGQTPLMLAIKHVNNQNLEAHIKFIFDVLIEYQANLQHLDHYNRNILHYLFTNWELSDINKLIIALNLIFLLDDKKNKIHLNKKDKNEETPLMIAIRTAKNDSAADLINILIDHSTNIGKKNKNDQNILHHLFMNSELNDKCKIEMAKVISLFGKNKINEKDEKGETPLMIALQRSKNDSAIDLTNILIDESTNINIKNEKGQNILHHLFMNSELSDKTKLKIASKIISKFGKNKINEKDEKGETPLMIALQRAKNDSAIDLTNILIDESTNINIKNEKGQNILHHLFMNSELSDKTKLKIASKIISKFSNEIVKKINEKDKNGETPLMIAFQRAKNDSAIDLINILIDKSTNINNKNNKGQNILHYLFMNWDLNDKTYLNITPKIISLFGKNKINEKDEKGETPLMIALQRAKNDSAIDLTNILIDESTNINIKNEKGQNILHHLFMNSELNDKNKLTIASKIISLFGVVKNKINEKDKYGDTPFMVALRHIQHDSALDLIKCLIKQGANVCIRNKITAQNIWHYLFSNRKLNDENKIKIVSEIISSPDNKIINKINEKDNYGETPLMIAIQRSKNDSAIKLIKKILKISPIDINKNKKEQNIWHYLFMNSELNDKTKLKIASIIISLYGNEIVKKINEKDIYGDTPFMVALRHIQHDSAIDLIKYLINKKASLCIKNKTAQNFWHYLFSNRKLNDENKIKIVSEIISSPDNKIINKINEKDNYGETPLMVAIRIAKNDIANELIKYLIKHSTNIDKKNKKEQNHWHNLITNFKFKIKNKLKMHS